MPILALAPAAATAFWGAVEAGAATATGIYGAKQQAGANREAGRLQTEGIDKQLKFQQDLETRRQQEHDQAIAEERAQWEGEQTRRAPYREAADAILRQRAQQMGVTLAPRPAPTMPPGGLASAPQAPGRPPVMPPPSLGTLAQQPPPMMSQAPMLAPRAAMSRAPYLSLGELAQQRRRA